MVTTSQTPNFMEPQQQTSSAPTTSQEQFSSFSLVPVIQADGNLFICCFMRLFLLV